MNRKTVVVVLPVILAVVAAVCAPRAIRDTTLDAPFPLSNSGFESSVFAHDALRCVGGTCWTVQRENIFSPSPWLVWYEEYADCSPPWTTGQPEARVTTLAIDPARVHSGSQAMNVFTFWRCHKAGLYQQVSVIPGEHYRASAFAHAWYSQCSSRPYDVPLEGDCVTPATWAHDYLSIGLDSSGGSEPRARSIVWSSPEEIYGIYGDPLRTPAVQATGITMTVFLRSITTNPLKHDDVYWDDVVLERVEVVWLPIIEK